MTQKKLLLLICSFILYLHLYSGFQANAATPQGGKLKVVFLSCGQGDAVVIHTTSGQTYLVDGGDDRDKAGKTVIIPYLKKKGIKKIAGIFVSHPHRDHFGGLPSVINAFPVGKIYYSIDASKMIENQVQMLTDLRDELSNSTFSEDDSEETALQQVTDRREKFYTIMENVICGGVANKQENLSLFSQESLQGSVEDGLLEARTLQSMYGRFLALVEEKGIPREQVSKGDILNIDPKLILKIFGSHDTLPSSEPDAINYNNYSLVFRLSYNKISYMFTGDAEYSEEQGILKSFNNKLATTILKSGHHGSETSSSLGFLDAMKPKYAVISCGLNNQFKHPHKETLDKYDHLKIKYFRTDKDGTVESETDGNTVVFRDQSSPIQFVKEPHVISCTQNSITICFETSKPSEAEIKANHGDSSKSTDSLYSEFKTLHYLTFSDLKPQSEYSFVFKIKSKSGASDQLDFQLLASTKPAGQESQVGIKSFQVSEGPHYTTLPLNLTCKVFNNTSTKTPFELEFFHSSLAPQNQIKKYSRKRSNETGINSFQFQWAPKWQGTITIFAVLSRGGEILEVKSLSIETVPRVVLFDTGHGNKGYYFGTYADYKMDLSENLGLEFHGLASLSREKIQNAFVIFIINPEKEFTAAELSILKDFVDNGGSILLGSKSDYSNLSKPNILNGVLNSLGSGIRFNDDQILDETSNAGYAWGVVIKKFPDIIKGVKTLFAHSAGSLVDQNSGPLKSSAKLKIIGAGVDTTFNQNSDELEDGFIYPKSAYPIPVNAVEQIKSGRVACLGGSHIDLRHYEKTEYDTRVYNRKVVEWLLSAKKNLEKNNLFQSYLNLNKGYTHTESRKAYIQRINNLSHVSKKLLKNYKNALRSKDQKKLLNFENWLIKLRMEPGKHRGILRTFENYQKFNKIYYKN
ncbi:ComEC/Rec2 family competence protein [Candidatus Riflebacteria bacterium]